MRRWRESRLGWSDPESSKECTVLDDLTPNSIGGLGADEAAPELELIPSFSAEMGGTDENAINPGTMLVYVRSGVCGDGKVSGQEACDPADLENGPTCSATCTLPAPEE